MFTQQIVSAIEGARSDAALVELSAAIWKGVAAGALGDEDAQRLAEGIHARRAALRGPQGGQGVSCRTRTAYPPRRPQRPPLRPVTIERRRRLAASGPLPPALACRFTTGELAVLRIVGDEARDRGACMLCLDAIAARAGVCRSLAKGALRQARELGLITVQERRRPGQKNLPNVIRVIDRSWLTWLARGPRSEAIGGRKSAPTDTRISLQQSERAGRAERNPGGRGSGTGKAGPRAMRRAQDAGR